MNFLLMLDEAGVQSICVEQGMNQIMSIAGLVILLIKIAVPIILVVVGMLDLAKATTSKDEDTIKKAEKLLIKRVITGVCVFLVSTIITLLMSVIGNSDFRACNKCINNPFGDGCIKTIGSNNI